MSHGIFVWYELATPDPKAAASFYGAVLGWTATDSGMPGIAYDILSAGPVPIAGLMAPMGGAAGWTAFVGVRDVDGSAAAAEAAGGTVRQPPTDIPGIGRFAAFADPQGMVFQMFEPGGDGEAPETTLGLPGHPAWHELTTTDPDAAWAFYAGLFGWAKSDGFDMGALGLYQTFADAKGRRAGGLMRRAEGMPEPGWLIYFGVEATAAAAARVTEGGGRVLLGPHPVPGDDWIAVVADPQGNRFGIVSKTA